MKMDLPKTREIWIKFEDSKNGIKLQSKHRALSNEIAAANVRLAQSESMVEYDSIEKEIEALKRQLKEVEIELRIKPIQEKSVRNNEMKQLPAVYNQEFKPYHDRYLKLDKELKKQLKKFAEETEPIAKEMRAIEELETSFVYLKMHVPINNTPFIRLPIDNRDLTWTPHWAGMGHGISSGVNRFIAGIKKIKTLLR